MGCNLLGGPRQPTAWGRTFGASLGALVASRPIHGWRSDPWCSNPDLSIRWPQGALTPLLGLALALLVLAGCSPPGPDQDTPANSITDDRGRFHAIGPHRSRVISLVPAVTETLVAIGAGDRLVARTDFDRQPELDSLPVIQGALEPSLEVTVWAVTYWAGHSNPPPGDEPLALLWVL